MGKTTCAAAHALAAARGRATRRVLVASVDPAHSLGDALGVRLTARPRPVPGVPRLDAMELNGPKAFSRWIGEHGAALGDAVEHGTWLDRGDVDAFLGLPLPGVDELVAMLEITRLSHGRYQSVVVDTAPTGHTLRLLATPDTVAAVASVLDALQTEHRFIRARFGGGRSADAADRLVGLLAGQARETGALLRDAGRTRFHWVMLPEMLSLAESEDGIRALESAGIDVPEIVVNRVIPGGAPCPICDPRRRAEREVLASVRRSLARRRRLRIVPAFLDEPRGVRALKSLFGQQQASTPERSVRTSHRQALVASAPPAANEGAAPRARDLTGRAKLVFVGGKGGVGKTTIAAAVGIAAARAEPSRRLLLLSTDPAHSLSDVFGVPIGDRVTTIPGAGLALHVRELDGAAALAARRADLEAAVAEIVTAFGVGAAGSRGVSELMDLAPPGVDELFGLVSVLELLESEYDTIIVDTAPTGHALRLLELPDAAREWVQALLRVLLKYRQLVQPGRLAAELVALSRQVRTLQELLRDSDRARFLVVTRAAEVPRLETQRLLARLRRLRIAVPFIVVNAVTMRPGRCLRCRATAAAERRQLAILTTACPRGPRRCDIIQAPLAAPPPRGVAALEWWAHTWLA